MSKKVLQLIRVSTEGQAAADRAGIPAQREANRRTAAHFGLEIVRTIEMSDVSGAAVLRTPEMQELLRLIESPEVHGVVTKEFSRLMRPENFGDYALLQAFAESKTLLYLPDGPIDFNSKAGRLLGGIRALIAGEERTVLLERSWAAKEEKRKAGKNPQSYVTLPFGVGYEESRGWYYKPEAERVREAFRLMMAGDTSYFSVARKLGFEPCTLRLLVRNPIYCGWRIIDERRDPSAAALRTRADGRQGDRRKIQRAPEDVIRVKVITDPLVSEEDFWQLQTVLDLKKQKHWRTNPAQVHHFTYNGFLACGSCGELVYTYTNRRENRYYVCKAKQYPTQTGHKCTTGYMRREELEPRLESLFSAKLTDLDFLREIGHEYERRSASSSSRNRLLRLQAEIQRLRGKRQRVMDSYIEGLLTRDERDARLADVERDSKLTEEQLLRETPQQNLSAEELAAVFAPFFEWKFLQRDDKRKILSTLVPEIKVANYQVSGLYVTPPSRHNEVNHMGTDSWRPPA